MDDQGWTVLTPSASTQIFYVSNSEGNDTNSGTSPASPLKTLSAGMAKLRNGQPDWLLLKRGDVWNASFGGWGKSGKSETEPVVLGTYGSGPRPRILTGTAHGLTHVSSSGLRHLRIVGLHFDAYDTPRLEYSGIGLRLLYVDDVLIEDCFFRGYATNITVQESGRVALRRSTLVDAHAVGRHAQGLFSNNTREWLVEGCIFDHNGWREGVADPTIFNHNIYITATCGPAVIRDNIFLRAAATGAQARPGGIVENNLFIRNPIALTYGLVYGNLPKAGGVSGRIAGNVVLESNDIGDSPRRVGIEVANVNADGVVMEGNIVGPAQAGGGTGYQIYVGNGIGIYNLVARDNIAHGGHGLRVHVNMRESLVPEPILESIIVSGNYFATSHSACSIRNGVESFNLDFTRLRYGANRYRTTAERPFEYQRLVLGVKKTDSLSPAGWRALTSDDSGCSGDAVFADPSRSVATYQARVGGEPGFEGFAAALRNQSKANWNPKYTTSALLAYFRDGYRILEDPLPPTPPQEPNPDDNSTNPQNPQEPEQPQDPEQPQPPDIDGQPLPRGDGSGHPLPPLDPVGEEGPASDATVIAHWDVVPYQKVSEPFEVGVVAFHANGIDRVMFSAAGGPWQAVSDVSVNPRTGVAEYWATLDPQGLPSGLVEVRAVAYPKRGIPRALESLLLVIDDESSAASQARWVAMHGDDQAGDGTPQRPYRTLYRAAQALSESSGPPYYASGGTIYLTAGQYALGGAAMEGTWAQTPAGWLTIAAAPGLDRSQVRITESHPRMAMGATLIRLHNVTVDGTVLTPHKRADAAIWFEGCALTGGDPARGRTGASRAQWPRGVFVTESRVSDAATGLSDVSLARAVTLQNIGRFALDDVSAAIDCSVVGMSSGRGKGSVLRLSRRQENVVIYGLAASECQVNALQASGPSNVALANVYLDTTGGSSVWSGEVNHLLLWHVAIVNEPLTFATRPGRVSNLSVQNSVFFQIANAHRLPSTGDFVNGYLVAGVDNNHFMTGPFIGTRATTGDVQGGAEAGAVSGSGLTGRVWTVLLPYDIAGEPVVTPGAIGPDQSLGGLAVIQTSVTSTKFEPLGD